MQSKEISQMKMITYIEEKGFQEKINISFK